MLLICILMWRKDAKKLKRASIPSITFGGSRQSRGRQAGDPQSHLRIQSVSPHCSKACLIDLFFADRPGPRRKSQPYELHEPRTCSIPFADLSHSFVNSDERNSCLGCSENLTMSRKVPVWLTQPTIRNAYRIMQGFSASRQRQKKLFGIMPRPVFCHGVSTSKCLMASPSRHHPTPLFLATGKTERDYETLTMLLIR